MTHHLNYLIEHTQNHNSFTLYIPFRAYRVARNIGSGKHWRIPLKTTLAKKTLANSNEKQRTLAICIADVEYYNMLDIFSITPYIITISGKLIE